MSRPHSVRQFLHSNNLERARIGRRLFTSDVSSRNTRWPMQATVFSGRGTAASSAVVPAVKKLEVLITGMRAMGKWTAFCLPENIHPDQHQRLQAYHRATRIPSPDGSPILFLEAIFMYGWLCMGQQLPIRTWKLEIFSPLHDMENALPLSFYTIAYFPEVICIILYTHPQCTFAGFWKLIQWHLHQSYMKICIYYKTIWSIFIINKTCTWLQNQHLS